MADGTFTPMLNTLVGGFSNVWIKWLFIILIGGAVIFFVAWLIKNNKKQKKKWNYTIRVWAEDPVVKRIRIKPYAIKACVITVDGGRYFYLQKPLKGGKLMPLVNYYSEPNVIDIILTSDSRFFQFTGFTGINKQRKELGIGIRFPGIDSKFDRVNEKYRKIDKINGFDRTLELLKKAAPIVFAIVLLISLIVGGNYYVKAKASDAIKSEAELQLMDQMQESAIINKQAADVQMQFWKEMKNSDYEKEVVNIGS